MHWATTTFRVPDMSAEVREALREWRRHIIERHPLIEEVRCYVSNGGTEIMWQEGFEDYHAYQRLVDEDDGLCNAVMSNVFRFMVPGTREARILTDGI